MNGGNSSPTALPTTLWAKISVTAALLPVDPGISSIPLISCSRTRPQSDAHLLLLAVGVVYSDTKGFPVTVENVGACILHAFNHQTHHRGQVSAAVTQFGVA